MNYKVNPDSLSAVFMVPSQIVDQHIKLAGGQQLKVLLWTLRHAGEGFDMEKLCRDLNFSVPDAQDYLQYWVETGILVSDGTADSAFAPKNYRKVSLAPIFLGLRSFFCNAPVFQGKKVITAYIL